MRVLIVGLGPIGVACARAAMVDGAMELVGLVDTDAGKAGLTLDELEQRDGERGAEREGQVRVCGSIDEAIASGPRGSRGAELAILTTGSKFDRVAKSVEALLERRISVVSSCEEMAWPWYRHAALAESMNARAQAAGCAVLGTGVNPGFVMDYLGVTLAGVVRRVRGFKAVRRVDASLRRLPLQAKVGATMTQEEFSALARARKIGHEGIAESVALVAAGMGKRVAAGSVNVNLEAVVAKQPTPSALGLIEPGRVAGIHNTANWSDGELTIELDLTMALGLSEPRDEIQIEGPVPLKLVIPNGIPGDSATVATLINCGRLLPGVAPGLKSMLDMPVAGCRGRD